MSCRRIARMWTGMSGSLGPLGSHPSLRRDRAEVCRQLFLLTLAIAITSSSAKVNTLSNVTNILNELLDGYDSNFRPDFSGKPVLPACITMSPQIF